MTQALDGSPLPEDHLLDALPRGSADTLQAGDNLMILGFPRPAGGMALIAQPAFGKFAVIDHSAVDGPWIRLGEAPPGRAKRRSCANARGEVVGWVVRSADAPRLCVPRARRRAEPGTDLVALVPACTELRPVESLEPELAAAVGDLCNI